jgi:hypothetical protein
MCGCMDVWMYGCMDVWMYGCMESLLLPTLSTVVHCEKYGYESRTNSVFQVDRNMSMSDERPLYSKQSLTLDATTVQMSNGTKLVSFTPI